jgi:N-formylglutamate amidohydrolase
MSVFEVRQGTSPVILGLPHTGTDVPEDIWARLNDNGRILADTDWHIHKLYDGLLDNVTTVRATFHRYCIDANRDPAGVSLYPGQNTTTLIPDTDFDGLAIWKDGEAPTEADIPDRIARFHKPYHDALAAEIERVKAIHGVAILYDCHSIRSHIPFLFEGKLPDFNIGTDLGKTCIHPQWPLQGRLDDAPLRQARNRRPRHPDGTGAIHTSGDRGRAFRIRRSKGRTAPRPSQKPIAASRTDRCQDLSPKRGNHVQPTS